MKHRREIILLPILAGIALASCDENAHAQTSVGIVTDESMKPSFVLTDANRLSAASFLERIVGRQKIFYRRTKKTGAELRIQSVMRKDGSFAINCEIRPPRKMDWTPCSTGVTDQGGSREVGTWRIADPKGIICTTGRTGDPMAEAFCYSYHEQGGQFAIKAVSGRYIYTPGNVEIR